MMTGCLRIADISCAMIRVATSVCPPGGLATTILIGLFGYPCACTAPTATVARAASSSLNAFICLPALPVEGEAGAAADVQHLPGDVSVLGIREEMHGACDVCGRPGAADDGVLHELRGHLRRIVLPEELGEHGS